MTAAEIIAGCIGQRIEPTDDGRWHASCTGADIGATGTSPADALANLETVVRVEIALAVERNAP